MKRLCFSLAIGLAVFSQIQARAAYDIFMQISNLTGESQDQNHKGWIDVYSFSHGMSKAPSAKPNHADFSLVKRLDKSSPPLNLNVNKGTVFPKITVEFQKPGVPPAIFYRVIMENAVVTNVSSSGDAGDDTITESIAVNYEKISWTYYQFDQTGKIVGSVSNYWDVILGKGG